MRSYKVPQELHGEEKIIGGVASLRQAAYIVVSFVIGMFVSWWLPISLMNKACIVSLFVVPGIVLGFVTIQGVGLDQLAVLYFKYNRKGKFFKYRRRERMW